MPNTTAGHRSRPRRAVVSHGKIMVRDVRMRQTFRQVSVNDDVFA